VCPATSCELQDEVRLGKRLIDMGFKEMIVVTSCYPALGTPYLLLSFYPPHRMQDVQDAGIHLKRVTSRLRLPFKPHLTPAKWGLGGV
jgi:hypothetical protein